MQQQFLDASFAFLAAMKWATKEEWDGALAAVRAASPFAGWTQGGTPSAPAAADPFIFSGEAIAYIARKRGLSPPYPDAYPTAYAAAIAPLRPELRSVLEAADQRGIAIHFVSNASTRKISGRLNDLFADAPALLAKIKIQGDAGKFNIADPAWDSDPLPAAMIRKFKTIPVAVEGKNAGGLPRPIYLRRGSYLRALSKVWQGNPKKAATTLVCGDVWELDLAMPAQLGCKVHLIERAPPFDTYRYERTCLKNAKGTSSRDLNGLLTVI